MKYRVVNERVKDAVLSVVGTIDTAASPPYVVEIRQQATKHSDEQRGLYFRWVDIIRQHVADTTGHYASKDEMHEWLAGKFQPTVAVTVGGETRYVRKSISKNSVKEMRELLELVDRYAAANLFLILPVREIPE